MVWIPGGIATLGSDFHYPDEAPARPVGVAGFYLDEYPVTNVQFAEFVDATGYHTVAERLGDASRRMPSSAVFAPPAHQVSLNDPYRWWVYVEGADWLHPEGPDSDLTCRLDHPVTHIAWPDAQAYAAWAGKVLPSEAEWEFAARGGLDGVEYAWGSELAPGGRHMANLWQGNFPMVNEMDDGYCWTSPIGTYEPNGYGLLDMIGNVWEWTGDTWSSPDPGGGLAACCQAPSRDSEPWQPGVTRTAKVRKVLKGGSFLCAPNSCRRFRPAARLAQEFDVSACHLGFRCAVRR